MTSSEIYKIGYNKTIMSTQNNLIVVTSNAKPKFVLKPFKSYNL
jgi:hypothetical protein